MIVNKTPNERFTVTRVLECAVRCTQTELQEVVRQIGTHIDEADRLGNPAVHQLQDTLRCIDHIGKLRFRSWGPQLPSSQKDHRHAKSKKR